MIHSIHKTLSYSFVALASVAIVSASQDRAENRASSTDSLRYGCSAPTDVDQGWEEQLARVEKLIAEKEADGLAVPGAIITPPFETFAPYRSDVPAAATAVRATKTARHQSSSRD
jgi:hypothetical protein